MARKALGRRDRHKQAIRESLLSAARSLLVSRSMDALSIDEIVERADVGRGTFYNYFADKDAFERENWRRTLERGSKEKSGASTSASSIPQRESRVPS